MPRLSVNVQQHRPDACTGHTAAPLLNVSRMSIGSSAYDFFLTPQSTHCSALILQVTSLEVTEDFRERSVRELGESSLGHS